MQLRCMWAAGGGCRRGGQTGVHGQEEGAAEVHGQEGRLITRSSTLTQA